MNPTRVLAFALAALACATPPRREAPVAVWPPGSDRVNARLESVITGDEASHRPWWRSALRLLVGAEEDDGAPLLVRPFSVAVAGDALVVADPDAPALLRFPRGGAPRPVECRDHEWAAPMAVAHAPDGTLFVADAGAAVVVRVEPSGACTLLGRELLERPTGVALGGNLVFVADPPRHVVVALSLDGVERFRIGGRGDGSANFNFPTAVAATPGGELLVVDALNFRISRFDFAGRWLGAFGRRGDEDGGLARPKGVAVGEDGRIYVSDAQRDLILVFSSEGHFQHAIGDTRGTGGWFAMPSGLAESRGRLFVADSRNHRIAVVELIGGAR
ncbi:MAG TPA: hypothetical protein VFL83_21435 [Anaeromyxobacter sp.]|nr:hypothetical protein [Anaeromyxobacter sp.]